MKFFEFSRGESESKFACLESGLTGDTTFCRPQAHGEYVLPVELLLAAAALDMANLRATPRITSWVSFLSTLLASIG